MLKLGELKELFHKYDFRPLKRFGENYLIDSNIKDKILCEARLSAGDTVLEIGPGMGAITIDLASSGATTYAVEKDRKAFAILGKLAVGIHNLNLIHGDILEFDMSSINTLNKIKVIGNLPYYITTPIIEYLINHRSMIQSAIIMVQKEVAMRILSEAGGDEYSSLSCYVQYYSKPTYVHTVKRTSFYPEPDVDSSLVKLDFLSEPSVNVGDESLLFKIIRGAFNQRRKSIINSLSRKEVLDISKDRLAGVLNNLKIDPAIRPEMLSLAEFARIANSF